MKIAVDLTSLSGNLSGLERYAANITQSMIRISRDDKRYGQIKWVLVVRNSIPEFVKSLKDNRYHDISVVMVRGNKLFINQLKLPAVMYGIGADVCLFPAFPVPLLLRRSRGRRIFGLIADTAVFDVPGTMKLRSRLLFGAGLKHTAKICDCVITISEFSASRIRHHLKPVKELILAPCAVDEPVRERMTGNADHDGFRDKYGLPDRYILAFSTLEPRKNTGLIAKAYSELWGDIDPMVVPPLVLAGRNGWKMKDEMEKICGELGDRVLVPGFIEDIDLFDLYSHAEIFADASIYEGFDMPPLEAIKCGVGNVIISDIPVHREVFGDSVMYFKSNDASDLAAKIRMCILKNTWDNRRQVDAIKRLGRYSWEKSAKIVLEEMTGKG